MLLETNICDEIHDDGFYKSLNPVITRQSSDIVFRGYYLETRESIKKTTPWISSWYGHTQENIELISIMLKYIQQKQYAIKQ